MKPVFVFLFMAIGFMACKSSDKKIADKGVIKEGTNNGNMDGDSAKLTPRDTANNTTIQWLDSTFIDLGKHIEGKEIPVSFRFKNTGSKNLIIENVKAGCGCTTPEKPEKPFAPGEEGVIKATFNGKGEGEVRKDVYVTANTTPSDLHTLTFRAEMVKK
jgi:hypothetical protein